MNDYLDNINTVIPAESLQPFLDDSNVEAALPERTSDGRLFIPPSDPTQPTIYNTAVLEIINDLQNIYAQLDILTSVQSSQSTVSDKELLAMETEVSRLEAALKANGALPAAISKYTQSKHVQFTAGDDDNNLLPKDVNHLEVDPDTGLLVRPLALSSSRLRSVTNNTMVRTSIENMLGTSTETRHPLSQAVDGSLSSYWREIIYADAPIQGNPATTTWLTTDYKGGAAARLRFDFEGVVPVSDIIIKQFCKYPMDILNVEYASYPTYNENFIWQPLQSGSFESLTNWDYAFSGGLLGPGNNPDNPAEFTNANGELENCFKVRFDRSAAKRWLQLRQKLATDSDTGLEANASYILSFYSQSEGTHKYNGKISVSLVCNTTIYGEQRPITVWSGEAKCKPEWERNEFLLTLPSDISPGSDMFLVIRMNETTPTTTNSGLLYTARIASVKLSKFTAIVKPEVEQTADNTTTVKLTAGNEDKPIMCRTLWLTCAQRYYTIEKIAIPYKETLAQNLWLAATNAGDGEFLPELRVQDQLLQAKAGQSPLIKAAQSLSSKVRALLAGLLSAADPTLDTTVSRVIKYKYELGAYEIDLKFRDHLSSGMWVSKPISSNGISFGEIRSLTVQPFMGTQESDRVRIYALPKSEAPVSFQDMVELNEFNSYTLAFNTPEDNLPGTTTLTVAPQIRTEKFTGTNRYNRLRLAAYPYTNSHRVAELHRKATTYVKGLPNRFNVYDPNAVSLCYVKAPEDLESVKIGKSGIYMTRYATTTSYGTTGLGYASIQRNADTVEPTVAIQFQLTGIANPNTQSASAVILYSPTLDIPMPSGNLSKGELSVMSRDVDGIFEVTYTAPSSGDMPVSGSIVSYIKTYATIDPTCALYTKVLINTDGELVSIPGYNPISITVRQGSSVAPPDTIGSQKQSRTKVITDDVLSVIYTDGKPELVIDTAGNEIFVPRQVPTNQYKTTYPIVWPANQNTAKLSLKWVDSASGEVVSTLDPSEYSIVWTRGEPTRDSVAKAFASTVILNGTIKDSSYTLKADYVTEVSAVSSIYEDYPIPQDFESPLPIQAYPVTRNITDYNFGSVTTPKPKSDTYQIHEYFVDSNGDIVFGSDLFDPDNSRDIEIEVTYETLGINPRIVIEYLTPESGVSTASSPTMSGYQILLNSRTIN